MSVVAAHLYRNGKNAKAASLDEPIDCKGKSEFVWIGLFEPSEGELKQLEKNYGLHPLAIEAKQAKFRRLIFMGINCL